MKKIHGGSSYTHSGTIIRLGDLYSGQYLIYQVTKVHNALTSKPKLAHGGSGAGFDASELILLLCFDHLYEWLWIKSEALTQITLSLN